MCVHAIVWLSVWFIFACIRACVCVSVCTLAFVCVCACLFVWVLQSVCVCWSCVCVCVGLTLRPVQTGSQLRQLTRWGGRGRRQHLNKESTNNSFENVPFKIKQAGTSVWQKPWCFKIKASCESEQIKFVVDVWRWKNVYAGFLLLRMHTNSSYDQNSIIMKNVLLTFLLTKNVPLFAFFKTLIHCDIFDTIDQQKGFKVFSKLETSELKLFPGFQQSLMLRRHKRAAEFSLILCLNLQPDVKWLMESKLVMLNQGFKLFLWMFLSPKTQTSWAEHEGEVWFQLQKTLATLASYVFVGSVRREHGLWAVVEAGLVRVVALYPSLHKLLPVSTKHPVCHLRNPKKERMRADRNLKLFYHSQNLSTGTQLTTNNEIIKEVNYCCALKILCIHIKCLFWFLEQKKREWCYRNAAAAHRKGNHRPVLKLSSVLKLEETLCIFWNP